jgi:crotonobetainyl-CoA:carnitine CoA-transferase CaiB-like acyl-CoA transferase
MQLTSRREMRNPLVNTYKTKDDRWLALVVIQPDPFWQSFCEHIDRVDLVDDPRFVDFQARMANCTELIDVLDDVFGARTLGEWTDRLQTFEGVWAVNQVPDEVVQDPQVIANGYLVPGEEPGPALTVVTAPAQFDGQALTSLRRAPEHGASSAVTMAGMVGASTANHPG